jgi:glycosyltransferase involved in cell wall biosynthesis/GT2 family glycosyltransferase
MSGAPLRVTVLDIEPIEPLLGGSRLRLKGLYHALGPEIRVTYVGAYHWPGPKFRRFRHGPNFDEMTIPFSDRHFAAVSVLQSHVGAYSIIDASFPHFGALSLDYCVHARAAVREADVVIFSHPWAFAVAGAAVRRDRQLVVYDAHNVESAIKGRLLGNSDAARKIAAGVERVERQLCEAADLVLACSHADAATFARLYDVPFIKLRVSPNGVFLHDASPATAFERWRAKLTLGIGRRPVAVFIGGDYPPNIEAVEFIWEHVAPACPGVTFALLGDAGATLRERRRGSPMPRNLRVAGRVSEPLKQRWLKAADIGINPMFGGSGTNVKMFDYMAAGLPIVTTPFGARGIEVAHLPLAQDAAAFAAQINALAADGAQRQKSGRRNRTVVERAFDWANISAELGAILIQRVKDKSGTAPFFSVTIPTLDRPEKLRRLFDLLAVQQERSFEVIVVDQSAQPHPGGDFGFELTVLHSRVRGQAHARNVAAAAARGDIIAFIDDDCEPADTWLAEARRLFDRAAVVGVEGRCFSDRRNDPAWRSVHNYGAEGTGFMTCNLFVRAVAFHAAGGFDVAFDEQQFRYDTDFGWRLLALGDVPFSERACVYHPPWSRAIGRESDAERDLLFETDPLLLRKHPERYRQLFYRERQWQKGERFWRPFLRGAQRYGVDLPDYIREHQQAGAGGE